MVYLNLYKRPKNPEIFVCAFFKHTRYHIFSRLSDSHDNYLTVSLADPGGGAHPARAPPPNGRGPMIFYAQNPKFYQFFRRSLRSRLNLCLILIDI